MHTKGTEAAVGVSATGQGVHASTLRKALLTVVVGIALFFYLYGPPLTAKMDEAANARCNELTGGSYRGYVLRWQTTTWTGVEVPHWECFPVGKPVTDAIDLGWWVDFAD